MYNLNVNVNPSPTAAAGLLGVAAAEVTPRTPEIVNSLIAMTNPFEGYTNERSRDRTDSTSSGEPSPPSVQHTCSQLIKEGTHPVVALIISYRVLCCCAEFLALLFLPANFAIVSQGQPRFSADSRIYIIPIVSIVQKLFSLFTRCDAMDYYILYKKIF